MRPASSCVMLLVLPHLLQLYTRARYSSYVRHPSMVEIIIHLYNMQRLTRRHGLSMHSTHRWDGRRTLHELGWRVSVLSHDVDMLYTGYNS